MAKPFGTRTPSFESFRYISPSEAFLPPTSGTSSIPISSKNLRYLERSMGPFLDQEKEHVPCRLEPDGGSRWQWLVAGAGARGMRRSPPDAQAWRDQRSQVMSGNSGGMLATFEVGMTRGVQSEMGLPAGTVARKRKPWLVPGRSEERRVGKEC